ncbi:hypothetical protein EV421DRAFT_151054 [Armillaria borealis]|uniref:Heterokaryon incompatibility domain-containing protein n=1 Tax=Armillaria borealis TaxID=47425 RepID=A0AA39JSD3_9AGAR|nr:hypothetical protein EV421DRAFT_151054 [Armillaria borealis]
MLCQSLFSGAKLMWNLLCSVFPTASTIKESPQEISDQNINSTIPRDAGPIVEGTLDSLSNLRPESLSESPNILEPETATIESDQQADHSGDKSDRFSNHGDYEFHVLSKIKTGHEVISAFTETGQAESSIPVPLQRVYAGGERKVISSSLADIPCVTLGVQVLLNLLNATLGTSYTLDTPKFLSSILEDCISNNYDFGTAYGRLRGVWRTSTIQGKLWIYEGQDQKERQEAVVGNQIVNPELPPRRVWDLYSNRVVPWWSQDADDWPRPISHGWMDEKDRVDVWTPINGHEWPVPIPKDASLDLIRIEMLNLGVEYAWLDVLCLRQKGGLKEDLRTEEWKLDVPTIGYIYQDVTVVCYLSGLGLPLSIKAGDLESDRSWFRRAWTLQENSASRTIAGDTPDGPLHTEPIDEDGNYENEILTKFHQQLRALSAVHDIHDKGEDPFVTPGMFGTLLQMRTRVSTNPVDKVAGLAFPLRPKTIAAYHESESLEDAWTALVNVMQDGFRGELFFWYPEPGNAGTKWRPSWDQVMLKSLPADDYSDMRVYWDEETGEDWCEVHCVEKGFVRGLAMGGVEEGHRCGELIVKDAGGIEHTFNITCAHKYPIPEDTYMLLGTNQTAFSQIKAQYWVVGRRLSEEEFEKVSVFEMADTEDRQRLVDLGIAEQRRSILV